MYDFILQLAFMGSLGTIVYLVARAVPRISDGEVHLTPHGKFDAWLGSLPFEQVDAFLNTSLEKTLRKTKIGVLKVDNLLTTYLNKVKSANGKPKNGNGGIAANPPADGPTSASDSVRASGNDTKPF